MLCPSPAVAEEAQASGWVRGSGSCPDPAAVQAEVFRLTSPEARAAHLSEAVVSVFDAVHTYSIEIDTGTERFRKTYSDPARECDKRVRFAAVYVVMTLMPPELAGPPETSEAAEAERGRTADAKAAAGPADEARPAAPSEPPPDEPAVVGAEQDERGSHANLLDLELGLSGQWSISSSEVPRISAYGGELLGALGRGPTAWVIAFGLAPAQSFEVGPVKAEMLELSSRTGARARWHAGAVLLALDASFVIAWRRIQGAGVADSEPQTVAELGAHAGVSALLATWRRFGPILGLRASYFPAPSELSALPSGRLGSLPSFWVGGLLGLHLSL